MLQRRKLIIITACFVCNCCCLSWWLILYYYSWNVYEKTIRTLSMLKSTIPIWRTKRIVVNFSNTWVKTLLSPRYLQYILLQFAKLIIHDAVQIVFENISSQGYCTMSVFKQVLKVMCRRYYVLLTETKILEKYYKSMTSMAFSVLRAFHSDHPCKCRYEQQI